MTRYPGLARLAERIPAVAGLAAEFTSSGGALLDALELLAARSEPPLRDEIENYVRSAEAARIGLEAAWADPSLAGVIGSHPLTEPADADQALRMAAWWRRFAEENADPAARRAALRIHDGYVRAWTAMV